MLRFWVCPQVVSPMHWQSLESEIAPVVGSSASTRRTCAWSVMPTYAVSPSTRTHSWSSEYFRSVGTVDGGSSSWDCWFGCFVRAVVTARQSVFAAYSSAPGRLQGSAGLTIAFPAI